MNEFVAKIDAGPIVLVDADQRGLVLYHETGAMTIIPHYVLKKFLRFGE